MKLLASGRQADVFDLGNGTVLRRYRADATAAREAAVMEHARAGGFPVPEVVSYTERDLVLQRVDGPSMLDDLAKRPWRLARHADTLAELHERLHRILAPPALDRPFGDGAALLHLDLHPGNVLLGSAGPVVIDWPGAAAGPPVADVAQTFVLLATSRIDGGSARRTLLGLARSAFLRRFLARFDRNAVEAVLAAVAAARDRDPNVLESERAAIRRLAGR